MFRKDPINVLCLFQVDEAREETAVMVEGFLEKYFEIAKFSL